MHVHMYILRQWRTASAIYVCACACICVLGKCNLQINSVGGMIYVWKLDKLIFPAWVSNICIKPWIGLQMFINCVCHNSVKSGWQAGGPLGRSSSETAEAKAASLAAGREQQERTLPLPMVRGANASCRGSRTKRTRSARLLIALDPRNPFFLSMSI